MKAVTKYVAAGMPAADAIKQALTDAGTSVSQLARDHKLVREDLSQMLNFRTVPRAKELTALVEVLGGTRAGWYEFWWTHAKAANALPPATPARAARASAGR